MKRTILTSVTLILSLWLFGCKGAWKDTEYPNVNITYPPNNASVFGIVKIAADAKDDIEIEKVDFYINGSLVGKSTKGPVYHYDWNTADPQWIEDEPHTIFARAMDVSNKTTSSNTITVTVDNMDSVNPQVSIIYPKNGMNLNGVHPFTVEAIDDREIDTVFFNVDGEVIDTFDVTSPYTIDVNVDELDTLLTDHAFLASAIDTSGNIGYSTVISFTVATD